MNKEELKDFILQCLHDKKAINITSIEMKNEVPLADYIIFASGRSIKNIGAIGEYVALEIKHKLQVNVNVEGINNSNII